MEYPPKQSSWGRAKQDTVATQKTARFMWGGESVLAVTGGTWLAGIAPIGASILEIVGRSVIGGLGGLLTALLVILSWNLFCAPYRQRNEARKKLQEIEAERKTEKRKIQHDVGLLVIEGAEVLRFFRSYHGSRDFWPVHEFKVWEKSCMDMLIEHRLAKHATLFFRDMSVDFESASIDDFIRACESGLNRLEQMLDEFE